MKKTIVIEISHEDLQKWLIERNLISDEKIGNLQVTKNGITLNLIPESPERKALLETKLDDLDFSVRLINVLKLLEVKTVRDILYLTPKQFEEVRNNGKKSRDELYEYMRKHNLKFKSE